MSGPVRQNISSLSLGYVNNKLFEELSATIDENGNIDVQKTHIPPRTTFVLNAEKALEKIARYRNFKRELKGQIQKIDLKSANQEISHLDTARRAILSMYRRRLNQLIAGQYPSAISLKRVESLLGEGSLSDTERKVVQHHRGLLRACLKTQVFANLLSINCVMAM